MPEGLPRVGSALLVRDEANRILLGKRNKDPQRGSWVIPGGKIRPFESIGEAATRELQEETGLEVEVKGQFRVYEIINPPDEHRIVIYSWGKLIGGVARASDDLSELAFFAPDQLLEIQTSPLVRKVLADAGFLQRESSQVLKKTQLNLFVWAILVPGADKEVSGKLPSRSRKNQERRPRTRILQNAPLLFGQ